MCTKFAIPKGLNAKSKRKWKKEYDILLENKTVYQMERKQYCFTFLR